MDRPNTRTLLAGGVLAGPLYLVVGVAQGLLRDGFDFGRHPLSVLARGTGGWIQIANFVVTGLMVIGAAVGLRRVLGTPSRAMNWFLGAFGASMLVASIFRADAMDGFPVGTPKGPPTTISTTGLVHFAAGGIGFVALAISALLAWRVLAKRGEPGLAWLSLACGAIVILGFFGGAALPVLAPVLGIWIAVVAGWVWLTIVSRRFQRAS
jgi:hypothetical protein